MVDQIDWLNAAIIAALIGGGFGLAKEIVAFSFRRAEAALSERRRRITLKARLAHFHTQNAIESMRALQAWQAAVESLDGMGLLVGPQAPALEMIRYDDPTLVHDAIVLADEIPDAVTSLAKAYEVRESIQRAFSQETQALDGQSVLYSYPRTRRLLRGLAEFSINSLEGIVPTLPDKSLTRSRGAKAAFKQAAKNLRVDIEQVPILSQEDVQAEVLGVSLEVRKLKGGSTGVA